MQQGYDLEVSQYPMAYVCDNTPLYYDAVNEKGLGMAGLNFVGNAVYREIIEGKHLDIKWWIIS